MALFALFRSAKTLFWLQNWVAQVLGIDDLEAMELNESIYYGRGSKPEKQIGRLTGT